MKKYLLPLLTFVVIFALGASVEWMYNPFTATGDMVYRNSSGQPAALAIGTNTYVLTSNGTVPTWAAAGGGGSAKQVVAGQSSHWSTLFNPGFLPLNASFTQATTTNATDFSSVTSAPFVFAIAGTLKNFYVYEDVAPTGGHDTIFVYKNGTVTTIVAVITNTATTGSDATHTVSVAAGDKVMIGGTGGSTDNGTAGTWSIEFDPS